MGGIQVSALVGVLDFTAEYEFKLHHCRLVTTQKRVMLRPQSSTFIRLRCDDSKPPRREQLTIQQLCRAPSMGNTGPRTTRMPESCFGKLSVFNSGMSTWGEPQSPQLSDSQNGQSTISLKVETNTLSNNGAPIRKHITYTCKRRCKGYVCQFAKIHASSS